MRSADQVQIVGLQELVHDVSAEDVGHAAVALGPALTVGIRVRPQEIAQQTFVRHVRRTSNVLDLVERVQIR